ncbi:MAG: glycosyltransferase family 39 protein [Chloroflexi bacterium]|nr:glycosyltransferase family 39 protein [Chloroflexota bacterium]
MLGRSPVDRSVLLVTASAFGLRVFRLGEPSLWYDEAVSVLFAQGDLAGVLANAATDNHPPLYFILLHLAIALTGMSEFAIRFPSVLAGTLLVPLVDRLARAVDARHGPLAGLIAGWLVALSPFAVRYAQEARMYTLLAALAATSCLLFVRALRGEARLGVGYAAVTSLALYTHLYTALLITAQAAGLAVWLATARKRPLAIGVQWALCQGLAVLLFLPWLEPTWRRVVADATYWPGTLGLGTFVWLTAVTLTGSEWLPGHLVGIALALSAATAILGILTMRGPTRRVGLILALLVVVPVVALYLLTSQRPKFHPRYLIEVQPALVVAMGAGLAVLLAGGCSPLRAIGRALGLAGLTALTALAVVGLSRLYFDPALARDDFRSVVAYVEEYAEPGDGILAVGGHAQPAVSYYLRRDLPVYGLPPGPILDLSRQLDLTVADALEPILSRHERLWLVLWQDQVVDPTEEVTRLLHSVSRREGVGRSFQGIHLQLFRPTGGIRLAREQSISNELQTRFVDGIVLVGYDLRQHTFQPGETIELALYWQAEQRFREDLTAFVHLMGQVDHIYSQIDRRAGGDGFGTSRWAPGRTVRDVFRLRVPPEMAPGRYVLEIGLYRPETLARLLVEETGENGILLVEVDVARGSE